MSPRLGSLLLATAPLLLLSGAQPRLRTAATMVAVLVPCAGLLLGLLLFAAFVPWAAVLGVAAATVLALVWLQTDAADAAGLVIAATFFALVVVPTWAVVIAAVAEDGSPFCGFD